VILGKSLGLSLYSKDEPSLVRVSILSRQPSTQKVWVSGLIKFLVDSAV
jgi:hypothetical protein